MLLAPPVVWLLAPMLAAGSYVLTEAAVLAPAEPLEASVVGERRAESEPPD